MQEVGAKQIVPAPALIDPRSLPVLLGHTSKRALVALNHAWVLRRRQVLLSAVAAVAVAGLAAGWQAREHITAAVLSATAMLEGEFAEAGFGIGQIEISGQALTLESEIVRALAIPPRISTLNYDAEAARARLEELPAIRQATIRKVYPDRVEVLIEEKVPVARWRIDGVTFLVDDSGEQIAEDDGSFATLPLVVGDGANNDAMAMIRAMERYPSLRDGLAALSRIGDRRWDLIYYSGLRVKLPEVGIGQALQNLQAYQSRYELLDRDVAVIDLRVAGVVSYKPVVHEETRTR